MRLRNYKGGVDLIKCCKPKYKYICLVNIPKHHNTTISRTNVKILITAQNMPTHHLYKKNITLNYYQCINTNRSHNSKARLYFTLHKAARMGAHIGVVDLVVRVTRAEIQPPCGAAGKGRLSQYGTRGFLWLAAKLLTLTFPLLKSCRVFFKEQDP